MRRSRRVRARCCGPLIGLGLLLAPSMQANEADVIRAHARCGAEGDCSFSVTLRHADVGWKHYADRFEVLSADGQVLATRVLRHPHVHEQPFTRTLDGVQIPPELKQVTIRAHDSLHGHGGRQVEVKLTRPTGSAPVAPRAEAD